MVVLCCCASAVQGQDRSAPVDTLASGDSPASDTTALSPAVYRDTLNIFTVQPFELRPFVLPGSERVVVDDTVLDTSQYRLDARHGHLWLKTDPPSGHSRLVVAYRTFPFTFEDVYRRYGRADTAATGSTRVFVASDEEGRTLSFDPLQGVSLQHSGSISRGVITGSNRDVAVESGLRMQLSGTIAEEVDVQAVLTDENTPIQPEGTTQRLEDFDRVFVKIDAPPGTARFGDVQLDLEGTRFARFSRKLQGAAVRTGLSEPPGRWLGRSSVEAAGATARGTYRSQQIGPIDGVQGPYRLKGENGEAFVLVVAGSERVYLDGERLERGETNGYTIDYTRGEITFTPRHLITEDRRITVEFEYRTSQFTRTLVAGQGTAGFWEKEGKARVQIGATFIREADSRGLSGSALDLSTQDSLRLARAGDEAVTGSGAERVPFEAEAPFVQYRREVRDSPGGTSDTVFVALEQAPPEGAPVYRVRFTRVGRGKGSYERAGRRANGIVYEYRGEGQGTYAPIRRLPRPTQKRLADLHGQFEPIEGVEVFGEWARSLNDRNRFSSQDAGDDRGQAYRAGVRLRPTPLDVGSTSLGHLSANVVRHARGQHFSSFMRTRPVEFGRKWNLLARSVSATGGIAGAGDETVDEASLTWAWTPQSSLHAEGGRLVLGDQFRAWRRQATLQVEEAAWPRLRYAVDYVTSRDRLTDVTVPVGEEGPTVAEGSAAEEGVDGTWLRQRGTLRKPLLDGQLTPRLEVEQERRQQRVASADSLADRSFSFLELRPGVRYRSGSFEAGSEVEFRTRQEVDEGTMRDASTAWTLQADAAYNPSEEIRLEGRLGYRHRRISDYFRRVEGREGTESVILEARGHYRPLGQAVELRGFYEARTERTPTLQEIYVRTGPERGQYVWEDADEDGLVQIDELLPERTPNEGTYVKSYVPSDSLMPTARVQARLRLRLQPSRLWSGAGSRWKQFLARAETQTTLEVRERSRTTDLADVYLLNLSEFRQPGLTQNGRLRMSQRVRLFPHESRYGLEMTVSQTRALSDLTAGTEERFLGAWEVEGRYKPARRWGLKLAGLIEQNRTASEAFETRRYDIESISVAPEVSFNPSPAVHLSAGASLAQKDDALGERQARLLKVPLEARYTNVRRLQVTARGEVANVRLNGDARGLAQFALTDGRGPGTSYRWGLGGRYAINSYLNATLTYDGRAPARAPLVNTLRLSLSASL